MNCKLSDSQIKCFVSKMDCDAVIKQTLIKQALNGDHGARFAIYGFAKRNGLLINAK